VGKQPAYRQLLACYPKALVDVYWDKWNLEKVIQRMGR
jgi:hypothetical protein